MREQVLRSPALTRKRRDLVASEHAVGPPIVGGGGCGAQVIALLPEPPHRNPERRAHREQPDSVLRPAAKLRTLRPARVPL